MGGHKTTIMADQYSCEVRTPKFYALCAVEGALSCGITHTAVVPLDLVKCRLQVDPAKYGNLGQGFKITLAEDGTKGLAKGWAPTLIGYSAQGLVNSDSTKVSKLFT